MTYTNTIDKAADATKSYRSRRSMNSDNLRLYPYYDCHVEPERSARQRRVSLFAKASRLTPKHPDITDNAILAKLREISGHLDHTSFWHSEVGTVLMLIESYERIIWVAMVAPEFLSIEVPTSLAPYCGQFSQTPGKHPGTRSYLLCLSAHAPELKTIAKKLEQAAKTAPAWNWIGGVK